MSYPIIDLHCDLLYCVVSNPHLTFESPKTNCSVLQLQKGKVALQTLAIASVTGQEAVSIAQKQIKNYCALRRAYPDLIVSGRDFLKSTEKLAVVLAIENASGLVEEDEPLEFAFERLAKIIALEKVLYISLTWNHENRFGGGNSSKAGLKPDGEVFLTYLNGKNIAIDLSHTSDALAYDILNYLNKKGLNIPVVASHSNFRHITPIQRNLPDELAKEIIHRKGLIGINFIRRFIGDTFQDFASHIEHGLKLGAQDALCFGADFYGGVDIPSHVFPERTFPTFQEGMDNASCYPKLLHYLQEAFNSEIISKIAYQNAEHFLVNQNCEVSSQR